MLKGISDLSTIGSRIKYYRLLNNFTQEELADKSGLDRTTIIRYENDLVNHSIDIVDKICKVFEIEPFTIYDDYLKFISDDYGSKIRNLRMDLGLSQKELGKMLGIHRKTVLKWENKNVFLSRKNYIRLIEFQNCR